MGIKFFNKNYFDLSNSLPVVTVTDSVATNTGQDFTDLMRNRNRYSGWMTTGSSDAGNTTLEFDFIDEIEINTILIVYHNLKSFTLQYWNGSTWVDFSTPINQTTNTLSTNYFNFTNVATSKLKLVINSTQVANSEKLIGEFIATTLIGELQSQPRITPIFDKDRKTTKYISGKSFVAKNVGGFGCRLFLKSESSQNDLALVETLFQYYEGFLVWLCGGDTTQFETIRQGYSLEDIFFMSCSNEYEPEWNDGLYKNGMAIDMRLVEVN